MITQEKKITIRQAYLLFIVLLGSLSITFVSGSTVKEAGQAAWISPLLASPIFFLQLLMYQYIFKKYDDESFIDILKNILGKYVGTAVGIYLVLWFTHYVSAYVFDYYIKVIMSIFPNMDKMFFSMVILLLAAYILRSDIIVIGKMVEVFFLINFCLYISLNILMLPKIRLDNFYPITYGDILPVIKSTLYITGMYCQILIIFTFSDRISGKKKITKTGFNVILLLTFYVLLVVLVPLGIFGPTLAAKMPMPYFSAVKQISLFHTLEHVETGVIFVWIFTDITAILVFSFAALHLMKSILKLSRPDNYINIYMLILFFGSFLIFENLFEGQVVTEQYTLYYNNAIGFALPLLLIVVGKIRKKL